MRDEDVLRRGGVLHGPHQDEGDGRGLPGSFRQRRCRHR
jgi:hypothetical protein